MNAPGVKCNWCGHHSPIGAKECGRCKRVDSLRTFVGDLMGQKCFFCSKPENGMVLLPEKYKKDAPRSLPINKTPCVQCALVMDQGLMLIEVKDGESGETPHRTGYITGVNLETAKKIFANINLDKQRMAFIEETAMKQILGTRYKQEDEASQS